MMSAGGHAFNHNRKQVTSGAVQVFEEVPILVAREVEVPYEVIIERPVENIVENRFYRDVVVEKEVEKIVDVPVEIVREEKTVTQVPRIVEVPRYVDRHYERVVEIPREVVKEVPVPVERVVSREVDRPVFRPHRTEEIEEQVVVDRPVLVDRVVERNVEVRVPVYVEREVEKFVDVQETIVRDVPYEVQRHMEVRKEVPVSRVIEVPRQKIVDRPVLVDRVVETPVLIDRVVERERAVQVDRVVEKPVVVDRVVERPVETRIERPYLVQTHKQRIHHQRVNVPDFRAEGLNVPSKVVVDQPFEVVEQVLDSRETAVDRTVQFPRFREAQTVERVDVEVPVERFIDEVQISDREIEVEIQREKFVTRPTARSVEKIVELIKTVERPVIVPRIVEKKIEKIVERRVEVPIEKFVERPNVVKIPKKVDVHRRVTRPRVVEKRTQRELRRTANRRAPSASQTAELARLGEELNSARLKNLKLEVQRKTLQEEIVVFGGPANEAMVVAKQVGELEERVELLKKELERVKRSNREIEQRSKIEVKRVETDLFTQRDVEEIERYAQEVERKNLRLRKAIEEIGVESLGFSEEFSAPFITGNNNSPHIYSTPIQTTQLHSTSFHQTTTPSIPLHSTHSHTTSFAGRLSYQQPPVAQQVYPPTEMSNPFLAHTFTSSGRVSSHNSRQVYSHQPQMNRVDFTHPYVHPHTFSDQQVPQSHSEFAFTPSPAYQITTEQSKSIKTIRTGFVRDNKPFSDHTAYNSLDKNGETFASFKKEEPSPSDLQNQTASFTIKQAFSRSESTNLNSNPSSTAIQSPNTNINEIINGYFNGTSFGNFKKNQPFEPSTHQPPQTVFNQNSTRTISVEWTHPGFKGSAGSQSALNPGSSSPSGANSIPVPDTISQTQFSNGSGPQKHVTPGQFKESIVENNMTFLEEPKPVEEKKVSFDLPYLSAFTNSVKHR